MTPEYAKEILPVIQAFAEGKKVQIHFNGVWKDTENPEWTYGFHYRIKPEPKQVLMTAEDLPPVVWLKNRDGVQQMVTCIREGRLETSWWCGPFEELQQNGFTWSADRKTWNSFMKEEAP